MYLECIFCFKGLPYQVPGVGVYVFADVNNHTGDVHCSGKRRTRTFRRSLDETPGSKFLKHACFHHMDPPDWADRLLAEKQTFPHGTYQSLLDALDCARGETTSQKPTSR